MLGLSSHPGNALACFPIRPFSCRLCLFEHTSKSATLLCQHFTANKQKQTWRTHRDVQSVTVYWWIKFSVSLLPHRDNSKVVLENAFWSTNSIRFPFLFKALQWIFGVNHTGRKKLQWYGAQSFSLYKSGGWFAWYDSFIPLWSCNWSINHSYKSALSQALLICPNNFTVWVYYKPAWKGQH